MFRSASADRMIDLKFRKEVHDYLFGELAPMGSNMIES